MKIKTSVRLLKKLKCCKEGIEWYKHNYQKKNWPELLFEKNKSWYEWAYDSGIEECNNIDKASDFCFSAQNEIRKCRQSMRRHIKNNYSWAIIKEEYYLNSITLS